MTGINGAAQYQLITHTAGGALDFQDQINDQNLITINGNYTTADVIRFNNSTALGGTSPIGYMSSGPGGFTCYGNKGNSASGTFGYSVPCLSSSYYDVASGTTLRPTWTSNAIAGPRAFAAAGTPAARAGATWDSLWSGNANGSYNSVRPRFTNASISDQFRPNDRFLINAALRYDDFTYVLPDSLTSATQFYANMSANYTCVLASTNQVLTQALPAGVPPPASAQYVVGDCNKAAAALASGRTVDRLGSPQRHRAGRRASAEFHGDLARVVLVDLLGAAFFGDLHDQPERGHPRVGRTLHATADLGIGSVSGARRR